MGAQRILLALGIPEPIPPALRTAMRGWIGYLDEMTIDRILHRDIDIDTLVELACSALVTTMRTATALEPSIDLAPEIIQILDAFSVNPPAKANPTKRARR
jgi:hypothetical protein